MFGVYYRDTGMPQQEWDLLEEFETIDDAYVHVNKMVLEDISEEMFNNYVYKVESTEKEI